MTVNNQNAGPSTRAESVERRGPTHGEEEESDFSADSSSYLSGSPEPSPAIIDEQFLPRLVSVAFCIFHASEGPKVVYQVPEGSLVAHAAAPGPPGTRARKVTDITPPPLVDWNTIADFIIPKEPLCGRLVTCTARALNRGRLRSEAAQLAAAKHQRSRCRSSSRADVERQARKDLLSGTAQSRSASRDSLRRNESIDNGSLSNEIDGMDMDAYHPGTSTSSTFKVLSHPTLITDEVKYSRNTFLFNVAFLFDGTADVRAYEPVVRKCVRQLKTLEQTNSFLSSPVSQTRMYGIIEQLYEDLNSYCETFIALPDAPHSRFLHGITSPDGKESALPDATARYSLSSWGPSNPLQPAERAQLEAALASRRRSSGAHSAGSSNGIRMVQASPSSNSLAPPQFARSSTDAAFEPAAPGQSLEAQSGLQRPSGPRRSKTSVSASPAVRRDSLATSALASSSSSSGSEGDLSEMASSMHRPSVGRALSNRSKGSSELGYNARPVVGRSKTQAAVGLTSAVVSTLTGPESDAKGVPPAASAPMLRAKSDDISKQLPQHTDSRLYAAGIAQNFTIASGSSAALSPAADAVQTSLQGRQALSNSSHAREAGAAPLKVPTTPHSARSVPTIPLPLSISVGAVAPAHILGPGKREAPHGLGRTVRDAINLKLFPTYANPPPVYEWQVPLALIDLARYADANWDLTMAKIFPFIDGINHVKRISQLADADIDLAISCMEHLLYYGCIIMIDIFQFFNMYTTRPLIATMATDESIIAECPLYVMLPGRPLQSWPRLLSLYSALKPGVTLHEWIEENDVDDLGIDVRRFVSFGIIKGFLRRVHRYPVLLSPSMIRLEDVAISTNDAHAKVNNLASRSSDNPQRKQTPSPLSLARDTSPAEERFPVSAGLDYQTGNALRSSQHHNRVARRDSSTGEAPQRTAPRASPTRRLAAARRQNPYRHTAATVIEVASVALDLGPEGESAREGSHRRRPLQSPLRSRGSSSSIAAWNRGTSLSHNAGASAASHGAETDAQRSTSSTSSVPPDLPSLLDATRSEDELCVRYGIPWSELHTLLMRVGHAPVASTEANQRARSGERSTDVDTWREEDMQARASGFAGASGWTVGGAMSGFARRTSSSNTIQQRPTSRRQSNNPEYAGATPSAGPYSAYSRYDPNTPRAANTDTSGLPRSSTFDSAKGLASVSAFDLADDAKVGTFSLGPSLSAWDGLNFQRSIRSGRGSQADFDPSDYGRVKILLQ
ncbi:nitrogen permease regulator 2 [Ceraceosorus bombacis]|uniref:Nitrogen permease regulator 2 n=1 Tax=Ceraceosorus bombacis TaxID=401625 RepID=A0A0P1BTK8_9BASI|nr:nitrogen permease regulator 2 [Ceraceosorus bombacis]